VPEAEEIEVLYLHIIIIIIIIIIINEKINVAFSQKNYKDT